MRMYFAWAPLMCALPLLAGSDPANRVPVTLVLQFEERPSVASMEAMKQELDSVVKDSGVTFEYKLRDEIKPSEPVSDIIVVKFTGRCRLQGPFVPREQKTAYAITHISDGEVLPFTDVDCDRVHLSIRPAMNGDQLKRGDSVFGRALGRVLAHEIYHILGKTRRHGSEGIARPALTGAELVSDRLELHEDDMQLMRREIPSTSRELPTDTSSDR